MRRRPNMIRRRAWCQGRTGRCFLARIVVLLFVVCGLAAGVGRQIGLHRPAPGFPLPGRDGCWHAICFFTLPDADAALAVLRDAPGLAASSTLVVRGYPGGYSIIQTGYTPPGGDSMPVLVYWSYHSYHITADWHARDRRLMRLGDVIVALGAPQAVYYLPDKVVLAYPERGLRVFVTPARAGHGWADLRPADAVITLDITNPQVAVRPIQVGGAAGQAWRGFGRYAAALG